MIIAKTAAVAFVLAVTALGAYAHSAGHSYVLVDAVSCGQGALCP